MDPRIRAYDADMDLDAVARIWREIGWLDSLDRKPALEAFLGAGRVEVGLLAGEAECAVHWSPGTMRYDTTDLSLCAIGAVTTSHIGRKQGLASTLTARALSAGAEAGAAVAALGMFEQGFYDRFGFGTGAYDHFHSFDPAMLMVEHVPYRPPVRITGDDWAEMHHALANRMLAHGSVVLSIPEVHQGEVGFEDNLFALGYRDDDGVLTHFVHGELKGEHGPWNIGAIAYQSTDQLLELLRLLRELGDQIRSVKLTEPTHIQLQTVLRNPARERDRSARSDHESGNRAGAWIQFRMLDVAGCIAARSWAGEPVSFNLTLSDPVEPHLDGEWRGVGGEYTVVVGADSRATRGSTPGLPTLRAGVGAFTRLWFAVRPPSVLAVTDEIEGPAELLTHLDAALGLSAPVVGWAF